MYCENGLRLFCIEFVIIIYEKVEYVDRLNYIKININYEVFSIRFKIILCIKKFC